MVTIPVFGLWEVLYESSEHGKFGVSSGIMRMCEPVIV
jgi:hypothetical protein